MQKAKIISKILIAIFIVMLLHLESVAFVVPKIKLNVKTEKIQAKAVRCNKCPCNCLIKPNKTGECGQYKNINGKLVPVKK